MGNHVKEQLPQAGQSFALYLVFLVMPAKSVCPPHSKSAQSHLNLFYREVCAGMDLCRRYACFLFKALIQQSLGLPDLLRELSKYAMVVTTYETTVLSKLKSDCMSVGENELRHNNVDWEDFAVKIISRSKQPWKLNTRK